MQAMPQSTEVKMTMKISGVQAVLCKHVFNCGVWQVVLVQDLQYSSTSFSAIHFSYQ